MHRRVNRQVRLKSRPSGIPEAEHFEIVEAPVPDVSDGRVLVRNIYLSVYPAMRGWVAAVANYSEPVALGAVMLSFGVSISAICWRISQKEFGGARLQNEPVAA